MGTDSHVFIERRRGDAWHVVSDSYKTEWDDRKEPLSGLKDRNYALFGVLAGVRSNLTEPLFPNRGLPPDASSRARKELKKEDGDAHSTTWFTVDELAKVNWDAPAFLTQVHLPAHAFQEWIERGRLISTAELWDAQIYRIDPNTDPHSRVVTPEEMTLLLVSAPPEEVSPLHPEWAGFNKKRLSPRTKKLDVHRAGAFAAVTTHVTLHAVVPHFVDVTFPELLKLGDPKNVRVIMWFDN